MTEKIDNTPDKKAESPAADTPVQAAAPAAAAEPVKDKGKKQASFPEKPAASVPPTGAHRADKKTGRGAAPAYGLLIIVLALAGAGLWYQHQSIDTLKTDLQSQLETNVAATRQAQEQARQALAQIRVQTDKFQALEGSYRQSQEQYQDLSQAFQALTDKGSDLILLNDIDHLATIAQQQLMLGGNVANAIIALESAQAQLARANRVGLAALQQTINGDLDRLRAASTVDLNAVSRQLDTLSALLAEAPLLVPDEVAAGSQGQAITQGSEMPVPEDASADASWWERGTTTLSRWSVQAWRSFTHDLGQFVSIRRVDDPVALMMSPDQAARFRESLNLRVMTAQMAMMMNQADLWQKELQAITERLNSRYDQQSSQVQQAQRLLRQLEQVQIGGRLPTVNNTLAAIEALRMEQAQEDKSADYNAPEQDNADSEADTETDETPEQGAQSEHARLQLPALLSATQG